MSDEPLDEAESEEPEEHGDETPQRREGIGAVLIASTVIFLIGLWLAVSIPVSDKSYTTPTKLGDSRQIAAPNLDTPEAAGRKVYIREGCATCHSQQVRQVKADAYLGAASEAGDYAYDDPQLIGTRRVGPDLTHFAGRDGTKDPAALAAHLRDPRAARSWSVMPSYSAMSDDDMNKLISYLSTLK